MKATDNARRMMIERGKERCKMNKENTATCSVFGCAKKLTVIEILSGIKCMGCVDVQPLISNNNLSWIVKSK